MSTRQTFTNLDFDGIMDSLKRFYQSQDQFKDYNFEGAGITQLLRLLSYNANNQAFSNNMLFNELHLDTAEQRNNVGSNCAILAYTPGSKKASTFVVDVLVTPPDPLTAPSELVMKRDARFMAVRDGTPYSFSPNTEYSAVLGDDGNYLFSDVKLLQGTWIVNSYDVLGSAIDVYEIPSTSIDIDTLDVSVMVSSTIDTLNTYRRYRTPYDLGAQNQLYYLSLGRNGYYQMEFGDDQLSKKLSDGNVILARYLVTEGVAGNGIKGITAASSVGGYSVVAVSEKSARSVGGTDEESIESIKKIAPINFRSGGAAVVDSDYAIITKRLYPEADDVISWGGEENEPRRYGYTFVAVKPHSSEVLDDLQKADLVKLLKKHNVGSMTPIAVDPTYYYLNVSSTIKYNPSATSLDEASLKKKVADYITTFSKNNLERFGRNFDLSQLTAFIKNIDRSFSGNVTQVEYEKHVVPELNFAGAYSINFNKDLKPNSVIITGFAVSDADMGYTYRIIDDGLGVLKLMKTKGTEVKSMGSAGSVNYLTGVVNLVKFRPNKLIGDFVVVKATSSGYDQNINALRSDIIEVNTVSINLVSSNA